MALFGNKSKDPNGSAPVAPPSADTPTADTGKKPGRGLSFGRKKDTTPPALTPAPGGSGAAQGGVEDFSDFAESVLAEPAATEAAPNGKAKRSKAANKPAARKVKTGTVVGVNIGNNSIKAVELRVKANEVELTAMAMVPTPEESISNGVIMSVTALATALRDLFKEGGFSSRNVVSSVAGTGALVVRVIEVPEMDDKELASNMKVDADRYIPFPPSEVIMDFKALRELPRDPASGNMEVLLAAAQREIIDLHVGVLQSAKLNPAAIDVEPLAAARAVIYGARGISGMVDYGDVSAVMNIGATSTEISVLRGDILVFTRAIPIGGNIITQQIVDNLALPWYDAERLKQEMGDALPPHSQDAMDTGQGYQDAGAGVDDWSSFNNFDGEPDTAGAATNGAAYPTATSTGTGILEEDWPTAETTPTEAQPPAATPDNATADPFDLDFFSQGPRQDEPHQDEPHEQHGQKEDEPEGTPVHSFDFSNFDLDEPIAATPAPAVHDLGHDEPEAAAPTMPPANVTEAATKAPTFNFSFPGDDELAPAPVPDAFNLDDDEAPTAAPAAPPEELAPAPIAEVPAAPAASAFSGFSFDMPEPETAPPLELAETPGPTIATSPTGIEAESEVLHPASGPSAYDLSDIDVTGLHPTGMDVTAVPTASATGGDDLDIDSLFDAVPAATGAVDPSMAGFDPASSPATDDFGMGFEDFGLGLTGGGGMATGVTNDADAVHAILRPILEELAGEVRRSLEYYASRYPDTVVSHVTLIGGGARLKNIDAFFTQMLGIPTTVGAPTARLTVKAPKLPHGYADANGPAFAVAIGLALRDAV